MASFMLLNLFLSAVLNLAFQQPAKPSEYLYERFVTADVLFKNGSRQKAFLNYNVLREVMVFEKNGELLDVVETETIDTIIINGARFVPRDKFFLEVVGGTGIPLYIQHRGQVKTESRDSGYGTKSETSSVSGLAALENAGKTSQLPEKTVTTVKVTDVYWVKVYGVMHRFITEKQFVKLFPGRDREILKFIKDNNIDIRKKEDLFPLLKFCNRL